MLKALYFKSCYTAKNIFNQPENFWRLILGRFSFTRYIVSKLGNHSAPLTFPDSQSAFMDIDIHKVSVALKRDGFFKGITLPQDILREISDFVALNDCYAGGEPEYGFKVSEKRDLEKLLGQSFYMAGYFNVSQTCPAISKVVNDPTIQAIAKSYIGKKARYNGCSLTWTFPVNGLPYDVNMQESCNFHYDIDDYTSLRFFFYLTHVGSDNGPHVCVLGSHKKKGLRHILNFWSRKRSDEAIFQAYGAHKIIKILGDSGSGFVEDTFCFHKGTVPRKEPRLLLMLHFAAHNYNKNGVLNDYRDLKELRHFNLLKETV